MNRRVLRLSAMIGAAAVSTLAVAPAFAASNVSSADAQALELKLAGNGVVTQIKTATNDGSKETANNASTLPDLLQLIPGNNALKAAVAVQSAKANADGTSYACAGIAGPGGASGGLVTVGSQSCKLDGNALSLDLGSLDLDLNNLLGGSGAIDGALGPILSGPLSAITGGLTTALSAITSALGSTPLALKISGGASVIEASCTANPTAAKGTTEILDTSGNGKLPISLTVPGSAPIVLANIDTNIPAKPGGTDAVVNLNAVTQAVIDAILVQVRTMLGGALSAVSDSVLKPVLVDLVQNGILTPLVNALKPLLQAISDDLLKITINDVTPGDGGKSVKATALDVQVLPIAQQFIGSSLVGVTVGKVSCGPNQKVTPPTDTPTTTPETPETPDVPTVVDSGLAGQGDSTTSIVLGATAALVLLAGTAGLLGYRRMLTK